MLRTISLSLLLILFASNAVVAEQETNEQEVAACESRCTDAEEACYERCPDSDEGEDCADACYSAADTCFNACDPR